MPDNEELFQRQLDHLDAQKAEQDNQVVFDQAVSKLKGWVQHNYPGLLREKQDPDRQTTAGELRALIADLPDDTPLLILFDDQAAVSRLIELLPADARDREGDVHCDWALPNTRYLDISEGQ